MLLWILFVTTVIFVYVKIFKPTKYWKERKVPHSKPWLIVGNMGPIAFRRTSFAECTQNLYNKCKGRYYGIYQFLQPTLILKDVELIKQITVKDFDYFVDHRAFVDPEKEPLFGKNLFSLKGEQWRDMRSTLSPAFTSSKMKSMFLLLDEASVQLTNYLQKKTEKENPFTLECKDLFTRYANDVIATSAFGIKCDSLENPNNDFYRMGYLATNFTGLRSLKFFGYTISPFLMKLFNVRLFSETLTSFFGNIVLGTIAEREKQGIIRHDMIHLLMEARKGRLNYDESSKDDESGDTGFATVEESQVGKQTSSLKQGGLTDDLVIAQAMLFFFAGFDTISALLCHMANELAVNPDIQKRLQDEIDETFKKLNGKMTYEALFKMEYLDMVICETLRKWPAAALTDRLCTRPFTIKSTTPDEPDLHLKKGDLLWLLPYAIHRDPKNFPDPDKFDPERFNQTNKHNITPFSYLPFGLGPRNCIGSRFALMEAKIVYAHLLHNFDIVVVKKTQIPLQLSKLQFNMNSEKGFWVGVQRRNM